MDVSWQHAPPAGHGRRRGLRICHIIDTLRFGGAERQFVGLLNALQAEAKFAVLLRDQGQPGFRPRLDPAITTLTLFVRLRSSVPQVYRLAHWLRSQRIDVVHTHMYWPNLYGTLAARLARVPVVVTTDHGSGPWKQRRHHWIDGRIIGRVADRRFCVSGNVLEVLRDVSRVPVDKLVPVVNATEIPEPVAVRGGDTLHIGAVGRLVWQKDFGTLLRAVALLRVRGQRLRLVILGDGPLRAELERTVAALGLADVVELPGVQQDVGAWLRRFDLFVMSSVEEGRPVALLEAMAHGLPVVATRVGGIPDTVADGEEGVLVPAGDPGRLAAALGELAEDVELRRRLGLNARARVMRDFSMAALARYYARAYRELLDAKTRVAGRAGAAAGR